MNVYLINFIRSASKCIISVLQILNLYRILWHFFQRSYWNVPSHILQCLSNCFWSFDEKKNGYESCQLTIAPEICFCVVTWLIDLKSNKTSTIIQEFIIYFFGAFYHLARNSQQINVVLTKFGGQFSIRSFI